MQGHIEHRTLKDALALQLILGLQLSLWECLRGLVVRRELTGGHDELAPRGLPFALSLFYPWLLNLFGNRGSPSLLHSEIFQLRHRAVVALTILDDLEGCIPAVSGRSKFRKAFLNVRDIDIGAARVGGGLDFLLPRAELVRRLLATLPIH